MIIRYLLWDGSFFRKVKLTLVAPDKNPFAHMFRVSVPQHAIRLPKSSLDLSASVNQIVNHPNLVNIKDRAFIAILLRSK